MKCSGRDVIAAAVIGDERQDDMGMSASESQWGRGAYLPRSGAGCHGVPRPVLGNGTPVSQSADKTTVFPAEGDKPRPRKDDGTSWWRQRGDVVPMVRKSWWCRTAKGRLDRHADGTR